MKNYLKSILFLITLFTITSCDTETPIEVQNDITYELLGSEAFSDASIINNIQSRLNSNLNNRTQSSFNTDLQFDFKDVQVASYTNTDVKAIIVNSNNSEEKSNYSYVTYLDENSVSESGFIINIERLGDNSYMVKYFADNLELIGEIITENGDVTYSKSYVHLTNGRIAGFWDDWGACVGDVLDHFTDGDPFHAAAGLGCIAAGAGCAAVVGIGCALAAS